MIEMTMLALSTAPSTTFDRIIHDMTKIAQPDDWLATFLRYAHNCPLGLIMEFGVASGGSLRMIANAAAPRKVYGFDWWQGLPEDWKENPRGTFACEVPSDLPANVELVPGLFQDTLDEFLKTHAGSAGFVNMDADLYSSTAFVLDKLAPRFVPGTIVHFDEIRGDPGNLEAEGLAFAEFLDDRSMSYRLLTLTGREGALFKLGWR
jgi:predicted O-methyltransferase YrrM